MAASKVVGRLSIVCGSVAAHGCVMISVSACGSCVDFSTIGEGASATSLMGGTCWVLAGLGDWSDAGVVGTVG